MWAQSVFSPLAVCTCLYRVMLSSTSVNCTVLFHCWPATVLANIPCTSWSLRWQPVRLADMVSVSNTPVSTWPPPLTGYLRPLFCPRQWPVLATNPSFHPPPLPCTHCEQGFSVKKDLSKTLSEGNISEEMNQKILRADASTSHGRSKAKAQSVSQFHHICVSKVEFLSLWCCEG